MAKLLREDVLKLASLAKLKLSDEEIEHFTKEIGSILKYVQQLQSVDVGKLEPTYQVTGLKNVVRADETRDYGASPEELLKNAPAIHAGQIKVKRTLQ